MTEKFLTEKFEKELQECIERLIQSIQIKLSKQEIKEIIESIIPDVDKLIASKVRQHFVEISEFIINKFKD